MSVYIEEEKMKATVTGLDEYGYLTVISEKGDNLSLQPDGNSFDMMRNLITMKK